MQNNAVPFCSVMAGSEKTYQTKLVIVGGHLDSEVVRSLTINGIYSFRLKPFLPLSITKLLINFAFDPILKLSGSRVVHLLMMLTFWTVYLQKLIYRKVSMY